MMDQLRGEDFISMGFHSQSGFVAPNDVLNMLLELTVVTILSMKKVGKTTSCL